jgi:hypothetical protein
MIDIHHHTQVMACNPAIDPPRFAPPTYAGDSLPPSPSFSRATSPSRHSRPYDPLGRDLSPTRTLKAFTSASESAQSDTKTESESKSDAVLIRLIAQASPSERAFGTRIAQTCKDIKAWHNELQQWPWAGSFEPPENATDAVQGPYWGSLRESQLIAYEQRVHHIREALLAQDVDELKDHVLAQHVHPNSTDYEHLDDFTALTTATILLALPDLSRLDRLLDTWSMRLTLLRKVPGYLTGLARAQADLDHAWSEMARHLRETNDVNVLRNAFQSLQDNMASRMGKMGGRLDSLLDDLEGRQETLPDSWIDAFETLEASHSDWLARTERQIISSQNAVQRELVSSPPHSQPVLDHDTPQSLPSSELPTGPPPPRHVVESPILGSRIGTSLPDSKMPLDVEADDIDKDVKNIPLLMHDAVPTIALVPNSDDSFDSVLSDVSTSHHAPVVTESREESESLPSSNVATPNFASPALSSNASLSPYIEQGNTPVSNVRTKAALLNGGIERTQALQKSVSPVRSFEHASMAFTKLFNRTNDAANSTNIPSRTSSVSSRSSAQKNFGLGIKNHEGFRRFNRSPSLTTPDPPADQSSQSPVIASSSSSPPISQATSNRTVSDPPLNLVQPNVQPVYHPPELDHDFFLPTGDSKSTIETNWDSPEQPEFPENWPLPVTILQEEIAPPETPMDSDMFEKMFVDSLPGTPQVKTRPQSQESSPFEHALRKRSDEPLVNDAMLVGVGRHRSRSASSSPGDSRSRHNSRPSLTSLSFEPITELPTPGSCDATPEVHDASAAGYFRAKHVQTSPGSRPSPGIRPSPSMRSDISWSNFSSVGAGHDELNEASDEHDDHERRPVIKRASVTSIENHARSELNTIEIPSTPRRTSSSSFTAFKTAKPQSSEQESVDVSIFDEPVGTPPAFGLPPATLRSDIDRSLATKTLGAVKAPPLNLKVHKRRYVVEPEPTPKASEVNRSISQPVMTKKGHARKVSNAEQLDRHVSRVLNTLSSRIAFKPSVSIPTGESSPAPTTTVPGPIRPRHMASSKTSRTDLTLSAVQPDSTSRRSNTAEVDGKMYHLTQEGKDQPIKLFVRLVGESERCMVRVGGGWADLGEYLRQYAEHHGHRTFSEGRFEVGSTRVGGAAKSRSSVSRPGSVMDHRPDSSMSFRSRSSFGAAGSTTPLEVVRNGSPAAQHINSTPIAARNFNGYDTPASSVKTTSRPSTADTYNISSSPPTWSGQEIGLAGPSSYKNSRGTGSNNRELDEQKARWVEEMMTRAKLVSSVEKKKAEADRALFSDMGKVGGTRRIMFKHKKHGSGVGENGSG